MNATTKRTPAAVAGKITAPVAKLTALVLAYAPVPASPEIIDKYQLKSPRKAFLTGAFGVVDVLEGDLLTADGVEYHVRAVGPFKSSPVQFTEIIMEQVQ
jgi:hypothetical protein